MNEIKNYINNIIKLINTEFANIAEKCGVLVRKGATVASYNSASKKATVYFDGDSSTESAPYYNKSGHVLEVGQRVYIFHLFGNPSQGWIMMRAGAYPDDEGGGGGGGLDGVVIDGSGNAMTNASLSDNILTLTKGTTFATQSDLTTHTGNSNIHVTSADKTRWDSKSGFSGSYNDLTDVPSSFTPASHSHGNITNDGGINTTTQIASGDRLIISDVSAGDLNASSITFGSDSGQYLANNGTWQTLDIPTKTSDLTNDGSDGTAQYLETDEDAYRTSSIPYGACDSTSQATAFTATVPGITELRDGVCMLLENGVITSTTNFTININGLGAKPVYNNMAAATRDTTIFNVNYTMLFIYDSTRVDGGCWICYRGYNSDNNTIGYQLRTNSGSLPMKSATYRYRILFTSADGKHFVPANNSTSTNATASRAVCQDKIDPFGRIVYYGSTTAIAADSRPGATALWDQYAITFGYSFNRTGAALTLTSWKPIYIKCAPQTDGSAIIDSTTPYVQDLPTSEDGKIYIFLGIAYSATAVELMAHHPVYWYKDGMIRPYTNGHEHSNKSVLDGITATNVSNWNTAATDSHTHSNKSVLDGISDIDVTNWDGAVEASHVHSNYSVLEDITSSDVSNWDDASANSHTHNNKSLLDSYTQTESDLADAVTKKHTHLNKTVLDGITSTNVANWNAKQDALTEGTDYLNKTHLDEGYASLDSNGKVVASQLPSYVDDVLEYANKSSFPATGETGKIYIDLATNLTYRWSGSAYVEISPSLALGETSSTAYRGDRGKIAYDHSQNGDVHVTTTQKTNWNTAYTNSHTHANKSLLDSYDQTNADISDAVSKKHIHSNKTVLDGIASTDITAWNGKYTKPSTGIPSTDLATAVQTSLGLADTAVQDSSYVHTDNNFTSTLKSKLDGIAAGAEVNVQADWSTTDSTSDAFIKNKPTLTTLAETAELSDAIPSTNYQTVSQAEKDSWNAKSTFSGNYSDLNGKPTIPTTLAQLASDTTHRVVTDAQINQWNGNYTLPSTGIPLNDLSQPVRDLLTNKTSLFESDIIIGDVYFKRYAAGRLMVSEVE